MADITQYTLRHGPQSAADNSTEIVDGGEVILVTDNSTGAAKSLRIGNVNTATSIRDLPNWNQFSDAEKAKLAGVAANADVSPVRTVFGRTGDVVAASGDIPADVITETAAAKIMTAAERSKLAGLPAVISGDSYQGDWDASTNTPTLAGSGMTPGYYWNITAGGTQFTRTFTTGHRAAVDSAGVLRDLNPGAGAVSSVFTRTGAVVAASGDYDADKITETATRVFVSPAQKTKIDGLPASAAPASHVGAGGSAHAEATSSTAGFMPAADKANADMFGMAVNETAPTSPRDGAFWYKASTGRLSKWDSTASRWWLIYAYAETVAPTVNDDVDAGVGDGCVWVDATGNFVYVCGDNTADAAKWYRIGAATAASLGDGTSIVGTPSANGGLNFKSLKIAGVTGAPSVASDSNAVTLSVPTRQTGAEMITAIDGEIGTDWHAGLAATTQLRTVDIVFCGNTMTWTDMPSGTTECFGADCRIERDLSQAYQIRFSRVIDGTFGASGAKLFLRYSVDAGSTWTTIGSTDLAIDGSTVGLATSWVAVPDLAKTANTWIAVFGSGGDGAIDPRIRNLTAQITFPSTTTKGVLSTPDQRDIMILPGGLAWNAPSPEAEVGSRTRAPIDLSNTYEIQYSCECTVAATDAATRQYLKWSTDQTTWTTFTGTEVALSSTGSKISGFATVPDAARQANAWVALFGGNATVSGQTATFKHSKISVKSRTTTPLLTASPAYIWRPVTMIQVGAANWTGVNSGNAQEIVTKQRTCEDTQYVTQIKPLLHVTAAGKTGSTAYLQYSTDNSTFTTIDGTSVAIDSTGRKSPGVVSLPDGAINPTCWFRWAADIPATPTGTTSFTFALSYIDLYGASYAEVPWSSDSGTPPSTGTFAGLGQTVTASLQAIAQESAFISGSCAALLLPVQSTGIHSVDLYNGRAALCNIKPGAGEVISGVGSTGQDVMPSKWVKYRRFLVGSTYTWVEQP